MGHSPGELDYDLTDKGHYYLTYLIHWDSYIRKFGVSMHHAAARSYRTEQGIQASLLEFLINILLYCRNRRAPELAPEKIDFKINKKVFMEMYGNLYRDLLGHLDQTDRLTIPVVSSNDMERYLRVSLGVIQTHHLAKAERYLFFGAEVRRAAREQRVPFEEYHIYDPEGFGTFVDEHVSPAEYVAKPSKVARTKSRQ